MGKTSIAKILEIGPYPPPMAGWSIRIRFVKEKLCAMGHDCKVLNLGKNRRIPSQEYVTVHNGLDYLFKTCLFAARGYTIDMHTNGDGPIGFILSFIAAIAGFLFRRRIVLNMHAGTHQRYFPRERSTYYFLLLFLTFKLAKVIICNNDAVKAKIVEYGISPNKIIPIKAFGHDYVNHFSAALPDVVAKFVMKHDPIIFTYGFLREGFYWDTLIQGMRRIKDRWPNVGLINAGALEDNEAPVKTRIFQQIEQLGLTDHICFAGDMSHDEFLSALNRAKLYLRTPISDGECSSVFESLTLGVPVVASENGSRPRSVTTYVADDPEDLARRVDEVISNNSFYREQIIRPTPEDTVLKTAKALIDAALC